MLTLDMHPLMDFYETCLRRRHTVHYRQAFKANPHQTKGRTRAAFYGRRAGQRWTKPKKYGGDGVAGLRLNDLSIDTQPQCPAQVVRIIQSTKHMALMLSKGVLNLNTGICKRQIPIESVLILKRHGNEQTDLTA